MRLSKDVKWTEKVRRHLVRKRGGAHKRDGKGFRAIPIFPQVRRDHDKGEAADGQAVLPRRP